MAEATSSSAAADAADARERDRATCRACACSRKPPAIAPRRRRSACPATGACSRAARGDLTFNRDLDACARRCRLLALAGLICVVAVQALPSARAAAAALIADDDDDYGDRQRAARDQRQQLAPALSPEERQHGLRFDVGDRRARRPLRDLGELAAPARRAPSASRSPRTPRLQPRRGSPDALRARALNSSKRPIASCSFSIDFCAACASAASSACASARHGDDIVSRRLGLQPQIHARIVTGGAPGSACTATSSPASTVAPRADGGVERAGRSAESARVEIGLRSPLLRQRLAPSPASPARRARARAPPAPAPCRRARFRAPRRCAAPLSSTGRPARRLAPLRRCARA